MLFLQYVHKIAIFKDFHAISPVLKKNHGEIIKIMNLRHPLEKRSKVQRVTIHQPKLQKTLCTKITAQQKPPEDIFMECV